MKKIFSNTSPFIIAEVGQNHNGNLDLAREYIKVFAGIGADAVKFQTRNNKYLFSKDSYEADYNSENAFAKTYGAHREVLELDLKYLEILKNDCIKYGVRFMSTPFDELSVDELRKVDVDILKIASFDLANLPLINKIASLGKPVVISIGGGNSSQIKSSVQLLLKHNVEISILHCVSEYPCPANRLGLDNIKLLKQTFPDIVIGSSDHFNGILSGPVAYMQGARVFEKHVTLDRSSKGTDHSFALEREGFRKFVRDIKRVEQMLTPKPDSEIGNEPVFKKLGKSLIAYKDINKGEVFSLDNLSGKIFKDQIIPVRESNNVIDKVSNRNLKKGDVISYDDF
jgi:sialic acid synthase